MVTTTALHLFAFGNATRPRPPRIDQDLRPDATGFVGPEYGPFPRGMSVFGDPDRAPIRGHVWRLSAGTVLPEGIGLIADGVDVEQASRHAPTHHTLYPDARMTFADFVDRVMGMPWEYRGKRR